MGVRSSKFLHGRAQRLGAVLTSACLVGGAALAVIGTSIGGAGAAPSCAASCFVAPGGNDSNAGTSGLPLLTIQAGVNAVDPGGTVHVAAGTYNESVNIAKAVTLSGANAGVAGTAARGAESLVNRTSGQSGPIFNITTSALVTINGFNAQFNGTPSNGDVVLSMGAANQLVFSNNLVNNSTYVNTLLFDDSALTSVWQNNLFTNLTQTSGPGTGVVAAWGATPGGAQATVTFTGNTFSHLADTDGVPAINLNTVKGTVASNTFSDIHQYGILLADTLGNLTISGNLFDHIHNDAPGNQNRGSGIRTFAVPNFVGPVTIAGNTFSNDFHAVRVANDGSPADLSSGSMKVNRNAFVNNSDADVALASGTTGTLDGTCNWWGQASGPGAGKVVGSVTTSPFLGTSNLAGACPAVAPTLIRANPPRLVGAVPLNNGAKVNWKGATVPAGGSAITGYVVTPYIGSAAQPAHVFASTATVQSITGLTNKTTYTFKVAATNADGTGAQSRPSAKATAGAPGKPGPATVTNGRPGILKVAFKAPMNNGAKISKFTATCTSSNGGVTRSRSNAAGKVVGVKSLTIGKKYTCTVFATNRRGNSPRSNPSAAVTA